MSTRAAQSPPQEGWRPIETAPCNGTPILLWKERTREHYVAAFIRGDHPGWCTPDGFEIFGASHWQPLPLPPDAASPTVPSVRMEVRERIKRTIKGQFNQHWNWPDPEIKLDKLVSHCADAILAVLSASPAAPSVGALELIDKRVAELRRSNDLLYGLDGDFHQDIYRNDCEINWLNIVLRGTLTPASGGDAPARKRYIPETKEEVMENHPDAGGKSYYRPPASLPETPKGCQFKDGKNGGCSYPHCEC